MSAYMHYQISVDYSDSVYFDKVAAYVHLLDGVQAFSNLLYLHIFTTSPFTGRKQGAN